MKRSVDEGFVELNNKARLQFHLRISFKTKINSIKASAAAARGRKANNKCDVR